MSSQGRVIQTSRGSFTDPPLEGGRGPQHDVPAKFHKRRGGAESAVTINQRPVAPNSDPQRQAEQTEQQVVEDSRHLRIAAGNRSGSRC